MQARRASTGRTRHPVCRSRTCSGSRTASIVWMNRARGPAAARVSASPSSRPLSMRMAAGCKPRRALWEACGGASGCRRRSGGTEVDAPAPVVLIVEDEDKIANLLRDYLRQHGHVTHRLSRGDQVEDWVRSNHVDLVLLDLMLPGRSGLEVCRSLRGFSDAAIIMVTARVDEIDRLLGLEIGADDYICKPFSPREVVARVTTVLRRTRRTATPATPERGGGLVLDEAGWRATLEGTPLDLTAVEFKLLSVLASQP